MNKPSELTIAWTAIKQTEMCCVCVCSIHIIYERTLSPASKVRMLSHIACSRLASSTNCLIELKHHNDSAQISLNYAWQSSVDECCECACVWHYCCHRVTMSPRRQWRVTRHLLSLFTILHIHNHNSYCTYRHWCVFAVIRSLLTDHEFIVTLERELCDVVMGEWQRGL